MIRQNTSPPSAYPQMEEDLAQRTSEVASLEQASDILHHMIGIDMEEFGTVDVRHTFTAERTLNVMDLLCQKADRPMDKPPW